MLVAMDRQERAPRGEKWALGGSSGCLDYYYFILYYFIFLNMFLLVFVNKNTVSIAVSF